VLEDARTYAAAMGLVAIVNIVLALAPQLQRGGQRPSLAAHDPKLRTGGQV
jgi:hypothetical protein